MIATENKMIKLNQLDYDVIDTAYLGNELSKLLSNKSNSILGGIYCDINQKTEVQLKKYTKLDNVLTSSGTVALLISLEYALNQAKDRKVVLYVSQFLYYTLVSFVKSNSYDIVVLKALDDEVTLEIPESFEDCFNIFIITSHHNKNSNVSEIIKKCKRENRFVIEDRCLVFGTTPGHSSDISCYSFSNNKMIISGEGGCVSSESRDFLKWAKWRTFSSIEPKSETPYFMYFGEYKEANLKSPYKCSISGIVALNIFHQCLVLDTILEKRRKNYKYVSSEISSNNIEIPEAPLFYTLKLSNVKSDREVKKIQLKFLKDNIQTHLGILPYEYYDIGYHNKKLLSLPIHSMLSEENLNRIVYSIKENT